MLRRLLKVPWTARRSNQSILREINPGIHIGGTDAEAEALVFWSPDENSWLIGKVPDAGKDWGQEKKGAAEDEMAGWHHQCNGHELGQPSGVGEGQGAAVHRVTKRRTWLSNWTTAAVITLFSVFKVTSILCSTVVMCVRAVASVMSDSLVLRPWDSPGMRCHALLQGTFQTLGLNPCLLSLALAGTFFTTSATWEAPAAKFSDYLKILLLEKVLRGDDSLSPNSPQSYASPTQPHPTFLPF